MVLPQQVLVALVVVPIVAVSGFAIPSTLSPSKGIFASRCLRNDIHHHTRLQQSSTTDVGAERAAKGSETQENSKIVGTVLILLPSQDADSTPSKFGTKSPVENPPLLEASEHLVSKLSWFSNETLTTKVMTLNDNVDKETLLQVDALVAMGLSSSKDLEFATEIFEQRRSRLNLRQCQFALDCGSSRLQPTVGPFDPSSPSLQSSLLPWTDDATGARMQEQMKGLFDRWTSDDFCVALLIFFNQFSGEKIDWVKHSIDATWEKGPAQNAIEFYKMITKCGDCITKCLADENCKQCIDALNAVDTRDQVASYRTVVSFESELLKEFSFCILQKNNIFGCSANIPTIPKVKPIDSWRGKPLTTEMAESILIAHLNDKDAPEGSLGLDISWKVAAGANVAYDQFPSQNQLFYKGVGNNSMWYDPVFRVQTIDGRNVWCKRHYRVIPQKVPGTFRLSVLDNGVTSNEFWTIAGAADDLSWIVFHYAGAASAVGQRYLGGLLCTPDGSLPEPKPEIWEALKSAAIQPWELFVVDNDPQSQGALDAGEPPLTFFRDDVLEAKANR